MKAIVIVLGVLAAASSASAQDCSSGTPDILTAQDWALTIIDDPIIKGMDIAVKLKNNSPKAIRMVDATYTFEDALGRRISAFSINPDLKIAAGETVETVNGYMGREMDRVPNMKKDDVRIFVCTSAVIYEDGMKEEFK